jgi:hypothetical protein
MNSFWWFHYQQHYHHPMSTHAYDEDEPYYYTKAKSARPSAELLQEAIQAYAAIQRRLSDNDKQRIAIVKERDDKEAIIANLKAAVEREHQELMKKASAITSPPAAGTGAPSSSAAEQQTTPMKAHNPMWCDAQDTMA